MLSDLYTRRALVWAFANRDFATRYRASVLGWAWSLIQPLATLIVFAAVFTVVFRIQAPPLGSGNGSSYAAFLFTGLVTWNLFSSLLNLSMSQLKSNGELLKKVQFPAWTPILGASIVQLVQILLELAVLIAMFLYLRNVGWTWILAIPILIGALRATDVDPGRGFTQRRLAATAIGRIGLRRATPVLLRALSDEALDFEGRPGAGMGIQYPVRTNLLWALGEIADPAAIPTLIGYLGNTSGSAFGGFYLAAMDALWKFGAHAAPALHEAVRSAPDTAAAHALGVLVALGHDPNPWIKDPRAGVSRLATRAGAAP